MPRADSAMSAPVVTRAPAKAILAGEHFVLYGVPALAAPVPSRALTLRLSLRRGPELVLPQPLSEHARAIDQALSGRVRGWVRLQITSEIPQGAGLGSSAALAVALGRALSLAAGGRLGAEVSGPLPDSAMEAQARVVAGILESGIHGRASGLDTAVIAEDRAIRFELQGGAASWRPLTPACAMPFLLVDTGLRRRTRAQVAAVARRRARDTGAFADRAEEVTLATRDLQLALETGDGPAATRSVGILGAVLRDLGLEPECAAPIRARVESHGGAVKVTGAGGGGFLLAVAPDPARLEVLRRELFRPTQLIPFEVQP